MISAKRQEDTPLALSSRFSSENRAQIYHRTQARNIKSPNHPCFCKQKEAELLLQISDQVELCKEMLKAISEKPLASDYSIGEFYLSSVLLRVEQKHQQ